MAIVHDASSAGTFAIADDASGNVSGTCATFSPPANSWIYVSAGLGNDQGQGLSGISNTGTALTWTQIINFTPAGSNIYAWRAFNANAQTNITVTVTGSDSNFTSAQDVGDGFVDVWTGANSSQTGAATATTTTSTATSNPSVTTTASGSQVSSIGAKGPVGAFTSSDVIVTAVNDGSHARVYKSANSGAAGSVSCNYQSGTTNTNGNVFGVYEILAPTGAGTPQPPDPDLPFWDEAVPTLHVDSYQNTNLDPQIDDPWPHWHEDIHDEWDLWQFDSAATPGFVDIPPPDAWIWPYTDDIEEQWELWQFDSAANSGFVDVPPPDGWYDPDDTADDWPEWQDDSQANSGFVDVPPDDGWYDAWDWEDGSDDEWWVEDRPPDTAVVADQPPDDPWSDDDPGDDWESWQDDSQANAGFVDVPPADPWDFAFDDIDDEAVLDEFQLVVVTAAAQPPEDAFWDDDVGDEWEGWQDDSAANSGFVDVPPADPWDWIFDDIEDELPQEEVVPEELFEEPPPADIWGHTRDDAEEEPWWFVEDLTNTGFVDIPPPDGWHWFEEETDDELPIEEVIPEEFFEEPPPADAWDWSEGDTDDEPWWFIEDLANTGFVDVPPADAWPHDHADDTHDEWWLEEQPPIADFTTAPGVDDGWYWSFDETADEWPEWQDDAAANSGFVDNPAPDGWQWDNDTDDDLAADQYALEDFELEADQPPDDPFVEDDAGDDWWVDDYQLIDNNPALSLEDAWAHDDLDAADPWEEWQFDATVGPDNNTLLTAQLDPEWDEVDDEWWVDEPQTAAAVVQPLGPDDPWDLAFDDIDDQWWLEEQPVVADVIPPPAVLQPTDIKVQRPSRRNVRFKWGAEEAIERERAPTTPEESTPGKQRYTAPSKLLQGLIGRLDGITGIAGPAAPRTPEKIQPAISSGFPERIPRETAAQRRSRRLALVEPRRQERARWAAENEKLLEAGHTAHLKRIEREAKRKARLRVVERGRLKRIEEIEKRVASIADVFAQLQRRLDTARRQRERLDALHKHLTRSAEEGDVRRMTARVQQVRAAEAELRQIHAELVQLSEAIGGDLGHDQEIVQLEQDLRRAYLAEAGRVEQQMMRSRNNLVAVQTAVRMLLGWRAPWRDDDESE